MDLGEIDDEPCTDEVLPNRNIENARLKPRTRFQPDYYAAKYACYVWKEHAPNFIKYIEALETGIPEQIIATTDAAIQDIWAVIDDEEKTLDCVAR